MPVPSVTGLRLDAALAVLGESAVKYEMTETVPPGRLSPGGPLRVIRQRTGAGGVVHLVVAPALPELVLQPVSPAERRGF